MLQDAPFIPIYFQRDAELVRPTVKGLRDSLFGHLPHVKVTVGSIVLVLNPRSLDRLQATRQPPKNQSTP